MSLTAARTTAAGFPNISASDARARLLLVAAGTLSRAFAAGPPAHPTIIGWSDSDHQTDTPFTVE